MTDLAPVSCDPWLGIIPGNMSLDWRTSLKANHWEELTPHKYVVRDFKSELQCNWKNYNKGNSIETLAYTDKIRMRPNTLSVRVLAAAWLDWWMCSCWSGGPVERSDLFLEVPWWLSRALLLWEVNYGSIMVFQTPDYKQLGMFGSSTRAGHVTWNDITLWVILGGLEGPLAEMTPPGWLLLPWRESWRR